MRTQREDDGANSGRSWRIKPQSLRAQVVRKLRDAIIGGDLAMGEQLVEQELAQRLGVSRAPVREALQKLEEEGLVDYYPRVGRCVHVLTLDEVQDVQEIRGMLEGRAARKLAEKMKSPMDLEGIDQLDAMVSQMESLLDTQDLGAYFAVSREFHETLVRQTENGTLIKLHNLIMNLGSLIWQLLGDVAARQREALAEHKAILESIRRADAHQAESLTLAHYHKGSIAIQNALTSRGTRSLSEHYHSSRDPSASRDMGSR